MIEDDYVNIVWNFFSVYILRTEGSRGFNVSFRNNNVNPQRTFKYAHLYIYICTYM